MENILVSVTRGTIQESCHRGHIAIVDFKGNVAFTFGNPETTTFFRSAAKPVQILSLIESGAANFFKFSPAEIAIMSGSHTGEEYHIKAISSILSKIGLPPSALQCGIQIPLHINPTGIMNKEVEKEKYTPLHNNCSGKHVAMLAMCQYHRWPAKNYLEPTHPIQRLNLKTISEMSGIPCTQIHIGIDGCSAPVFGIPISAMALAYARLTSPHQLGKIRQYSCRQVTEAITKHPYMASGTGRLCARIIAASKGTVLAKTGAEAVYCLGLPRLGLGATIKIEDGSDRPLASVVIEVLKQLGMLSDKELESLRDLHHPKLTNHQDVTVGEIKPVFSLQKNNDYY